MSDWIEWNGGECPVGPTVKVRVRFRDGTTQGPNAALIWGTSGDASISNWAHADLPNDIIAYCVEVDHG